MAVPLGVLGAIYLHEYGGTGRLARLIRFMTDVMTGRAVDRDGPVHLHRSAAAAASGSSGFGGSLALACLMLPIVIRSTEEMLRLVPDDLRQASYALGNRKWRTILTVVLPAALGGHRQRRHAGRGPGRRRDGAAAVHHRRRPPRSTGTSSSGPNTALSAADLHQRRRRRSPPPRTGPGARRSPWSCIVFLLTVLARLVSARFSLKHQ